MRSEGGNPNCSPHRVNQEQFTASVNNADNTSLFSILRSLPGGVQHVEHSDFTVFDFPRFAAIYSIEDGTKLVIKNVENQLESITINRGELLVFRGDVEHCGAAYDVENRRLYFKIIPKGAVLGDRELDSVGHRVECPKCKKGMYESQLQELTFI